VSPSRLRKRIARAVMVSWREQPTRYDIEALQANIRRVGLVVRVRWVLIGVLVIYSMLAGGAYAAQMPPGELARLMLIPALSLAFVVVYNTYYSLNYKRLGNIAVWNNLQLALDAVVVTVLVYFSGGVNSWFWSMYALFILEAAFILPTSRAAWAHALFSAGLLGLVEWSEFVGILPHVNIPFAEADTYSDFTFVAVRYLWQVAVLLGMAWISTLLVGEFRRELNARRGQRLIDETTDLYSRSYFMRASAVEVRRAGRDSLPVHVILIDIDKFGDFNERFGIDVGDRLLRLLADAIVAEVAEAGDVLATTNLGARIGGEEFAVLLAEDVRVQGPPSQRDAMRLAEQIRAAVERVRLDGAGVTVSVGVASAPDDGAMLEPLLDAADNALVCACEAGGNRVVAARDCLPETADAPEATEA